jgi:hypothetical protein
LSHLITSAKNDISGLELARQLDVKWDTAWLMKQKLLITYGFFRTFGNELAAPNRGQVVVGIPQPSTEPETTNERG